MGEYINIIIAAFLGSGGITGVFFYFLTRSIEKRLKSAESEAEKRKKIAHERAIIDDKLFHAYGRLFFWLYKAVVTGTHNGDLEKAFLELQQIEAEKKDLDRNIIVESERGV